MKTLLFVDDETRVLQGLQRQLHALRSEWDMHFIESGVLALAWMASHPVDVVVSDMMMPGMDGAQFLAAVSQRHPQTVRIILSGHAARESVVNLVGPAHLYLSKPCDSAQLRRTVSRAFALRDLLGCELLMQMATRIQTLPALPAFQRRLTEELQKDEPSPEAVSQIISRDVSMAARILQLVNSAFFGLPQSISNLTDAVMYLGLSTVGSLTLSLHLFDRFDKDICPGFSLEGFMGHSWQTAVLARRLAREELCDAKLADQCFLAGLLHDIGRLVLASQLREEYPPVLRRAENERLPVWQAERAAFGASHANVGAYLLGLWGLPDPIVEAAGFHHQPEDGELSGFGPVLAVHVANALVHQFNDPDPAREATPEAAVNEACLARLGLAGRLAVWRDLGIEEILT